jgi:hypothetical protein
LNIKKSNYITFKPGKKDKCITAITNDIIDRVKEVCFLGVILDERKAHVSYIAHEISKSIGIIYRSSFYLFKYLPCGFYILH